MSSASEILGPLVVDTAPRDCADGEMLCREGELSTEAFVVITGEIEAFIESEGSEVVVGVHGPGALVGEVTTVVGGTRTASLRARGSTQIAVLGKEQLSTWLDEHPDAALPILALARERTDRTRVASMLSERLGPSNRDFAVAISGALDWVSVAPGECLFEKGDPADGAYLVVSGQLRCSWPDGRSSTLSRGDVIGAAGLFVGSEREMTGEARRMTTLGHLTPQTFEELTRQFPRAATELTWRLSSGPVTGPTSSEAMTSDAMNSGSARTGSLARSIAIVCPTEVDGPQLLQQFSTALEPFGSTMIIAPATVDRLLAGSSLVDVAPDGAGEIRLAELLHQAEVDHDFLLLDGTGSGENWRERVLRQADHVVIICSPRPTEAESDEIDRITEILGGRTPTWLAVAHPPDAEQATGSARLLDRFAAHEVHHLRNGLSDDAARVARLCAGRGTALVLSGGGGRGFAHLGVIDSLGEHGHPIDRIVGASMGSVIAAAFAMGLSGEPLSAMVEAQFEGLLDYTVPLVSILRGQRIAGNITTSFGGHDIEDLWIPFACVSTNLTRSRIEEHRRGALHHAIRASVAIPGILPPVPMGEDLLIDGGVLDNLPIDLVKDDPSVGTIIAVDVSPPTGPKARTDFGLSVSAWAAISDRLRPGRNQLPSLSSVLMRSVSVSAARTRDVLVGAGTVDLYLDLDLGGVGLLEFESVRPIAKRGYDAADPRISEWLGT